MEEDELFLLPLMSRLLQRSGAECKLTKKEQSKILGLRKDQTLTVWGQVKDISTVTKTTFEIDDCQILSEN